MAYSGTISETIFTTRQVIETAARRCKIQPSTLTAESVQIANNALYLFLSDLANQGAPLWCIEKQLYPLYDGVPDIVMEKGTVDVLNGNTRRLQVLEGMETVSVEVHEVNFTTPTTVAVVGVKWNGPSVPITFERSDTGADWDWKEVDNVEPEAEALEWTWYDMPVLMSAAFFRVRSTEPGDPLMALRVVLGNSPTEIPLARLNRDDFTSLPNKTFKSNQPLQYWFDRQVKYPVMHLWPVPDEASETSQVVVWRQRHIMDVGPMTSEVEVPQRWYEAIVSGLAAKLAMELPEVEASLIPILDAKATNALNVAQSEERDNSPTYMAPNISPYTR